MGLCQETFADKWGQAAGPPSEDCWACGLVRREGAKPQRPRAVPDAAQPANRCSGCRNALSQTTALLQSLLTGAGGQYPREAWARHPGGWKGVGGDREGCGNCLVTPAVHSNHHAHLLALWPRWGLQCHAPQAGASVGGQGLTWKGRSTVPLPIWFTLGRDPP